MVDREHAVVAKIQQGADVALTTLQLCTSQDFYQEAPGFPNHARQAKRAELVGGFAAAVAAVNVEDILRDSGQGP
jgi:hypothetical protein